MHIQGSFLKYSHRVSHRVDVKNVPILLEGDIFLLYGTFIYGMFSDGMFSNGTFSDGTFCMWIVLPVGNKPFSRRQEFTYRYFLPHCICQRICGTCLVYIGMVGRTGYAPAFCSVPSGIMYTFPFRIQYPSITPLWVVSLNVPGATDKMGIRRSIHAVSGILPVSEECWVWLEHHHGRDFGSKAVSWIWYPVI